MTTDKLELPQTTGIGSLPHHNIDSALEFAFRTSLPYLPQIPIRNDFEFMLPQSMECLPGIEVEKDGIVRLNLDIWKRRSLSFSEKLKKAFSQFDEDLNAFEVFEPTASSSSSWLPFLWELEERKCQAAKIQLAGPLTTQWGLQLKDGTAAHRLPDVSSAVQKLVLAKALAMHRRLRSIGVQTLFFFDEPALFAFSPQNPLHQVAFQELKLSIQTLKKDGALVGVHCCSNMVWRSLLETDLDFISFDVALSLRSVFADRKLIRSFVKKGGRFSFGIIPTVESFEIKGSAAHFLEQINSLLPDDPELVRQILSQALYSPACGLALQTPERAEFILSNLLRFEKMMVPLITG